MAQYPRTFCGVKCEYWANSELQMGQIYLLAGLEQQSYLSKQSPD